MRDWRFARTTKTGSRRARRLTATAESRPPRPDASIGRDGKVLGTLRGYARRPRTRKPVFDGTRKVTKERRGIRLLPFTESLKSGVWSPKSKSQVVTDRALVRSQRYRGLVLKVVTESRIRLPSKAIDCCRLPSRFCSRGAGSAQTRWRTMAIDGYRKKGTAVTKRKSRTRRIFSQRRGAEGTRRSRCF